MKDFYHLADEFLSNLANFIEEKDQNSLFDVEYLDGILTITNFQNGKQFVVNRHNASQKIWYSSPISGADYFVFDETKLDWLSDKKEILQKKLLAELNI